MNDEKAVIIKGLQSNRKYLPDWFRYDNQGSIYYDLCLENDEYNYFNESQVNVLSQNAEELVGEMKSPCVLVDMGSGNAAKTRIFIDVLLQKQETLTYIPVDISAQHLKDTCDSLTSIYGNKLNVQPVAGKYENGFDYIRTVAENKLILWFSSIQNLPFDTQPRILSLLSDAMQADDKLFATLDVTQDKEKIETKYGGPTECFVGCITNGLGRLNRDYGANIALDTFKLHAEFIRSTSDIYPSYVTTRVESTKDQTIYIPGLGITVKFTDGESLMLHDGEGLSCKYNEKQIKSLAERGHLRLDQLFIDKNGHAALCCLVKN